MSIIVRRPDLDVHDERMYEIRDLGGMSKIVREVDITEVAVIHSVVRDALLEYVAARTCARGSYYDVSDAEVHQGVVDYINERYKGHTGSLRRDTHADIYKRVQQARKFLYG
jgi:hypothetical protein